MKTIGIANMLHQQRVMNSVVAVFLFGILWLAYANSFIQDDAFISFRYAHNLVHDQQLTWNPGEAEKIEGYTNFLWTIIMSLPIALDIDPIPASKLFGLFFALGTLLYTYNLSRLVFHSPFPALLSMVLLGTNYTFSAYASGGLETQMQTFLITLGTYLGRPKTASEGEFCCSEFGPLPVFLQLRYITLMITFPVEFY